MAAVAPRGGRQALLAAGCLNRVMHVSVSRDGKKAERTAVAAPATLASLVRQLGLNDQTFFSKVNGKLVHPATELKDGDAVEFVGIIYGG